MEYLIICIVHMWVIPVIIISLGYPPSADSKYTLTALIILLLLVFTCTRRQIDQQTKLHRWNSMISLRQNECYVKFGVPIGSPSLSLCLRGL